MDESGPSSERRSRALRDAVASGRLERCAVVTSDGFVLDCVPPASQSLEVGRTLQRLRIAMTEVSEKLALGALTEALVVGEDGGFSWMLDRGGAEVIGVVPKDGDLGWSLVEMRVIARTE